MPIPMELITLAGASLSGFLFKMSANKQADTQQQFLIATKKFKMVEDSIANAKKDQSSFANVTRRFIVVSVFVMLVFILVAGIFVPTNMIVDVPAGSFLGLFSWGGGTKIITVTGLVAYPWMSHMVCSIIGYYFGQGSAKRV